MGCGMCSIYPAEALCSEALRRSSANSPNYRLIEKQNDNSPKAFWFYHFFFPLRLAACISKLIAHCSEIVAFTGIFVTF